MELSKKDLKDVKDVEKDLKVKDVEKKGGKFRYQTRCGMITYRSHLDKVKLKEFLVKKFETPELWECLISHEISDKDDEYEHTHVVFSTMGTFNTYNCLYFDFEGIHPNLQKYDLKLLAKKWNYICKQDNVDMKKEESLSARVWSQPTLQDALSGCTSACEVMGTKILYDNRPKVKIDVVKCDYKWQTEFIDEVKGKGSDRKIVWICDEKGGGGKTSLVKFLMVSRPKDWYCMTSCSPKDAATIIAGALDGGWSGFGMFVNLTRTEEEFGGGVYKILEMIKDGLVTAAKYQGKTTLFNNMWLVVMANWWPKYHMLSMDRWDLRSLDGGIVTRVTRGAYNIKLKPPGSDLMSQVKLCAK